MEFQDLSLTMTKLLQFTMGTNFLMIIAIVLLAIKLNSTTKLLKDVWRSTLQTDINTNTRLQQMQSMFESISQRIIVLNRRLKIHFDQFGIKDIENIKKFNTHYVKNRRKNSNENRT
jgi:hypothetical protein